MNLLSAEFTKRELPVIAQKISGFLKEDKFCLWLIGEIGAGKTTVAGAILHELGLPRTVAVTSPTFTYLNDYSFDGKWYAHIDCYRADQGFTLEDLGALDSQDFSGYFIEWPSSLPGDPIIQPTHTLTLAFVDDQKRKAALSRLG